jgi:hypothetical protein
MRKWTHESKFRGQTFIGGYEYSKKRLMRVLKFKNSKTGREIAKEYGTHFTAKKDGWVYE